MGVDINFLRTEEGQAAARRSEMKRRKKHTVKPAVAAATASTGEAASAPLANDVQPDEWNAAVAKAHVQRSIQNSGANVVDLFIEADEIWKQGT